MKNIAIIVNSLRFGGAEVQTVELANSLCAREYNVVLFAMANEDAIRDRVDKGVEVVMLGKKRFLDFGALSRLIRKLKDFRADVVVMANSYSTLYGYMAHFFVKPGYRMVSVQHTTLFVGIGDALKNLVYMRVINRMHRVVFVCHAQKKHWIENYGIQDSISTVIYNGIDLERFLTHRGDIAAVRRELGFSGEDVVIGINANMRPEKRHEDMVDALEKLVSQGYPVKLLFIGDGVRRKKIEEYIKSKHLEDRVVITGFVRDVRPYLAAVDISALTSTAVETLSIAAIESMAMGKAIILSDIGGARELVEPGENGFVYPAGNIGELVEVVKRMIDKGLTSVMGDRSRDKAVHSFGREEMVKRYMVVLEEGPPCK